MHTYLHRAFENRGKFIIVCINAAIEPVQIAV